MCPHCKFSLDIQKIVSGIKKEEKKNAITLEKFAQIVEQGYTDQASFTLEFQEDELVKKYPDALYLDFYKRLKAFSVNVIKYKYICKSCNSSFIMLPNTVTASFNFEKKIHYHDNNISLKINDSTLPRTKDYICPNADCPSHKDDVTKEAVIYRANSKNYNVKYACTICLVSWFL
ncbi:putative DNA-dependent RNA polymerase subunit Rpb9 [Namao virus]|nr:putative DNA-dependent RNA polymerase subunit Rpb9 [Namao virus]